jgi:hypothetical protein
MLPVKTFFSPHAWQVNSQSTCLVFTANDFGLKLWIVGTTKHHQLQCGTFAIDSRQASTGWPHVVVASMPGESERTAPFAKRRPDWESVELHNDLNVSNHTPLQCGRLTCPSCGRSMPWYAPILKLLAIYEYQFSSQGSRTISKFSELDGQCAYLEAKNRMPKAPFALLRYGRRQTC